MPKKPFEVRLSEVLEELKLSGRLPESTDVTQLTAVLLADPGEGQAPNERLELMPVAMEARRRRALDILIETGVTLCGGDIDEIVSGGKTHLTPHKPGDMGPLAVLALLGFASLVESALDDEPMGRMEYELMHRPGSSPSRPPFIPSFSMKRPGMAGWSMGRGKIGDFGPGGDLEAFLRLKGAVSDPLAAARALHVPPPSSAPLDDNTLAQNLAAMGMAGVDIDTTASISKTDAGVSAQRRTSIRLYRPGDVTSDQQDKPEGDQ